MKKNMIQVRQGDVYLRQVKEIPADAQPTKQQDRIVLALGEVTGHAHAIHDLENTEVFVKADGTMYLSVKESVNLQHEEHGTITLPPGNYERVIQREYSPEAIRNVAD